MAKLLNAALLLVIVSVGSTHARPEEPSYTQPDTHASGVCTTSGEVICNSDCKQLLLCTRDGDIWHQNVVQNCIAGQYCDSRGRDCHVGLTSCSPTNPPVYNVNCTSTGLYPDPFDCTVFHVCATTGVLSDVRSCPVGWAYDPLTTRCDMMASNSRGCVDGPIPKCEFTGQSGPVPENPNIYYVCIKQDIGFLPQMFRCDSNGLYDGYECVH